MNANEKIYVRCFDCSTTEDVWEQGEVGGTCSYWTNKDLGFANPPQGFGSVEDALKAVCKSNCFDYKKENWISFGKDYGEEYGRFDGDFLVDAENSEASESEKEEWKAGKKRLWACHACVQLEVRAVRQMTEAEANEF